MSARLKSTLAQHIVLSANVLAFVSQHSRTLKRKGDVRTDVVLSDEGRESGTFQHRTHLGLNPREDDLRAITLRHQAEIFEIVYPRGVNERHTTHANDANGRMVLHLCRHLLKAIRHPKEEGSINFIHLHPIGDGECLFVEGYVCHWIGIRVNLFGENRQLPCGA